MSDLNTTIKTTCQHLSQSVLGACGRFVIVTGVAILVSGCMMSGMDIDSMGVDKDNITGSVVKTEAERPDNSKLSDQNTVRNIVSAMNFTQWGKNPIPWANPVTGSQGTITAVAEKTTSDGLCREFETSREAFDGAAIYRGQACMAQGGHWALTAFAPL